MRSTNGRARLREWRAREGSRPDADGAVARRISRTGDETGATLVLALLFLVVIGLLVGGLASWTANDLSNEVVFQNARSAEFALNSATQLAIQNIRYAPLITPNAVLGTDETLNASPPEYCWGSGPTASNPNAWSVLTTQGYTVAVYCSTLWNPALATTRQVTISACLISSSVTINASNWQTQSSSCAGSPGLQTEVTFDDYSSNLSSSSPCTSTCGASMTINSSSPGAAVPTVTVLAPTSGPVTGGTALTITGSGFVNGSTTVFFVDPVAANNVVTTIQPGSVTYNSASSISVTTPGVTTVANYYVVVSTPQGNSLDGPTFGYQLVTPQVTGISPNSGSANGGTAVTINGTGFLSNDYGDTTTVNFTNTADPSCTVSSDCLPAPDLSVNSSGTVITATSPAIISGTTYDVTVTTKPGGTSPQTFVYTFQPFYPVADSITPASGGSTTAVTITGLGFLKGGTTVNLIPTGSGSTLTLTNVSVSSPTSLTAQVPTGGTNNATYYVSVTTTWGATQYQSCSATSCLPAGAPTYTY